MKRRSTILFLLCIFTLCLASCCIKHKYSDTLTQGTDTHWYECECGEKKDEKAHDYTIAKEVTKEATCTEAGIQIYACECGATKEVEIPVVAHEYASTLTQGTDTHWYECECGEKKDEKAHDYTIAKEVTKEATCTEVGIQIYACECGATKEVEIPVAEHEYASTLTQGTETHWYECECGAKKDEKAHTYVPNVVEATCNAEGYTEYTCECGHSYIDEESKTPKLQHIDENIDILCDHGCGKKVIPATGSTLTITHAINLVLSNMSLYSYKFYLEGTITEITDYTNGGMYISDGTATFFIRISKNSDGTINYKSLDIKHVVGDKIRVYGKIEKSTTSPYNPQMAEGWVVVLEQHTHEYADATCTEKAICRCGQQTGEPLGHKDENGDKICDVCEFNTAFTVETVVVRTDNNSGVLDEVNLTYTWGNDNFDVTVAKAGGGNLYKTSNDHMRFYKNNELTLTNKNNIMVSYIEIVVTNTTQLTNFQKILTGYTFEANTETLTIKIELNSSENFVLKNTGSSTLQFKSITMFYEA